jgi:hypothetical protein
MTRFFTTSGAIVSVSPTSSSATFVFHTCLPVDASTAMVYPSSWLKTILPSAWNAPRLIRSQQAIPMAAARTLGRYFQRRG